ncbi:hypothetical protein IT417_03480 [bacterium]|nr:hypothetical protein [bacterium]
MNKRSVLTTLLLVILSITSYLPTPANATNITPGVKSYVLSKEDILLDEITYKNESNKSEIVLLTVSAYDAKTEKSISDSPFLALKKKQITIPAKKEVTIPYVISIPKETPVGTYFNVILIQKKEVKAKQGNVNVIPSVGVLLSFHIEESNTSINQIFFNQSDIQIVVTKKGLPYLSPTEFEYQYTNNSNFVFKPEGEIRILNASQQQILDRYEINPQRKAIYPGESFTQSYSVKLWPDVQSIFSNRNIVSKTYNDIQGSPVLNKVEVSILYQVGVIGGVAVVLILILLWLLISWIISAVRAKKTKESTE